MVKWGEVLSRPRYNFLVCYYFIHNLLFRYIMLYDLLTFVVSTMLQYMISSNDQVSKAVTVVFVFIKFAGWVVFIKAKHRKLMKIYFWIRVGYNFLVTIIKVYRIWIFVNSLYSKYGNCCLRLLYNLAKHFKTTFDLTTSIAWSIRVLRWLLPQLTILSFWRTMTFFLLHWRLSPLVPTAENKLAKRKH